MRDAGAGEHGRAHRERPLALALDLERAVDGHHQLHQVERMAARRPGALDDVHAALANQRRVLASRHGRERTTRAQAAQAIVSSGDAPAST
ncbi:hypothetical protein [Sorangium sp. So ce1182]|uniref:hypothetical protein n=1 Tax=Sorangium sp. So ce1182 TaxID=3133334 RepID=UPI003F5FFB35